MALTDDAFAALTDLRLAMNEEAEIGCHVFLFATRTRERRDEWHRVAMDGGLAARFVEATRTAMLDVEAKAGEADILAEFDFDAMTHGSIGVVRTTDVPELRNWLNELPADDLPMRFTGDEGLLEKVRFYATRLNFPDGRTLRTFRGRRGLNIVIRTRGISAIFNRDLREMIPVEGTVISFDQEIDFFEWDGFLFIMNLLVFESITNVREVTVKNAHKAIEALTDRFQIEDTEILKAEIGKRTRLAKKLAAAFQHGLFGDIDIAQLPQRIVTKKLAVQCVMDGENCRLIFDPHSRSEVEDFVNLVSDFFLNSPVTGREWEAIVKRPARERR